MPARLVVKTTSRFRAALLFDASLVIDLYSGRHSREAVRIRDSRGPQLGDTVTWSSRVLGREVPMVTRIVQFDWPRAFAHEQISGPFRSFRHERVFRPCAEGTEMVDTVDATLGFGQAVDRALALPQIRRHLLAQNACVEDALESEIDDAA